MRKIVRGILLICLLIVAGFAVSGDVAIEAIYKVSMNTTLGNAL